MGAVDAIPLPHCECARFDANKRHAETIDKTIILLDRWPLNRSCRLMIHLVRRQAQINARIFAAGDLHPAGLRFMSGSRDFYFIIAGGKFHSLMKWGGDVQNADHGVSRGGAYV